MDFKKLIRYRTLDRCFATKERHYTIEDLFEAIKEAYKEYGFGQDLKIRQLRYDITFMKSKEGWNIKLKEGLRDGKKGIYQYEDPTFSILNQPIHPMEQDYLRMAIFVLDRFKTQKGLEWVNEMVPQIEQELMQVGKRKRAIQFSRNLYTKGLNHIESLFEAIVDKVPLEIHYQPFGREEIAMVFHPYLLKEYNNRWFLFGQNPEYPDSLTNLALDRINRIQELSRKKATYIPNKIDLEDYFDDIIGVTRPPGATLETIELRFSANRAKYILTKPLHHSQKGKQFNEDGTLDIQLSLMNNRELRQMVLEFGSDVEVLEPLELREWVIEEIEKLRMLYK